MNDKSFMFLTDVYIAAAAMAGAITSLSLSKWQTMSGKEIFFTLAVGFFFAIFITPLVAHEWLGVPENNIRILAALTYACGSGCNVLLPLMIRGVAKWFGAEENKDA